MAEYGWSSQCFWSGTQCLSLLLGHRVPFLGEADAEDENIAFTEGYAFFFSARLEVFGGDRMRRPWIVRQWLLTTVGVKVDQIEKDTPPSDAMLGPVSSLLISESSEVDNKARTHCEYRA